MVNTEDIRRTYLPKQVRLLLVGESPPDSDKFFYLGSPMTKHTARAFEDAYGVRFHDDKEFLTFFKEHGCYLEDLSVTPVNKMSPADRTAHVRAGVADLSRRIAELNPDLVVTVLRRIESRVREAVMLSSIPCAFQVLPFPGQGHQNEFVARLSTILKCSLIPETRIPDAGQQAQ
jgi:hypothetical protein